MTKAKLTASSCSQRSINSKRRLNFEIYMYVSRKRQQLGRGPAFSENIIHLRKGFGALFSYELMFFPELLPILKLFDAVKNVLVSDTTSGSD